MCVNICACVEVCVSPRSTLSGPWPHPLGQWLAGWGSSREREGTWVAGGGHRTAGTPGGQDQSGLSGRTGHVVTAGCRSYLARGHPVGP